MLNPRVPLSGSRPSAPPSTHASCNDVSERPNADVRTASSTSRWMIASRPSLPAVQAVRASSATSRPIERE